MKANFTQSDQCTGGLTGDTISASSVAARDQTNPLQGAFAGKPDVQPHGKLPAKGFLLSTLRAGIDAANGPSGGAAPGQTANQTRRNGTGQLPACDLVGWLKTEAQGCREGTNGSAHTVYPQGGEADTYQPLKAQGKGGCRVKLCSWPAVSLTVERGQNTRETPRGENFALRARKERRHVRD